MDADSPATRNACIKAEDHDTTEFPSSLKRPATDIACGVAAKKLRQSSSENGVKNAVMLLNEIVPGLQYMTAAESGPSHNPTFTMTVEYCGQVFAGDGSTKKQAKLRAAEEILNFIRDQDLQSFSDSPEIILSSDDEASPNTSSGNGKVNSAPNKNPISVLNERNPGLVYEVVSETGLSHNKTFTISVSVDGQVFRGTGHSKKMAKMEAARLAMETIYDYVFPANSADMPWRSDDISPQCRVLGDKVAESVLTKFAELTENLTSPHSRYKVIAGVALTANDDDLSGIRLISLATGSKCIGGEFISMSGTTLNDLHAEILAIRGCRLFILNELEKIMSAGNADESVETVLQWDPASDRYMMKPNVKLHLFISSAPCGDSRIFSPQEESNPENQEDGIQDRHPNRVTRGQLRTKIECGEGTIPVKSAESAQTWDGIVNGERLLTMSCSDKIACWNVLGLQGSILSHLMQPVYLDSVVVGRLFSIGHLKRALYERIGQINSLPADYRINQPLLSPITHTERRNIQKAPGYACAWVDDGKAMEVITTNSGKLLDGSASKLSKLQLFKRFAVLARLNRSRNLTLLSTYSQMKLAASAYQNAKVALYEAFEKAGHGRWVRRPPEQDQFTIDEPKNS